MQISLALLILCGDRATIACRHHVSSHVWHASSAQCCTAPPVALQLSPAGQLKEPWPFFQKNVIALGASDRCRGSAVELLLPDLNCRNAGSGWRTSCDTRTRDMTMPAPDIAFVHQKIIVSHPSATPRSWPQSTPVQKCKTRTPPCHKPS